MLPYDGWESIGEHIFSSDGKYVVYTIIPQEGDGRLVVSSTDGHYRKEFPRGAGAAITSDSRYLVFQIKPFFKDSREARIKKKTPEQSPKDSLAWLELGRDSLVKVPRVKSFKIPAKKNPSAGDEAWLAYLLEKSSPAPGKSSDSASSINPGQPSINPGQPAVQPGQLAVPPAVQPATQPDSLTRIRQLLAQADSLTRVADSLRSKVADVRLKGMSILSVPAKKENPSSAETVEEGTDLIIKNLNDGKEKKIPLVSEYLFSARGNTLVVETTRKKSDTLSKALILWMNIGSSGSASRSSEIDTVMRGFQDARNYTLDEEGRQLAFVAERDSVTKALVKFYRLWYYRPGMDSAGIKADRRTLLALNKPGLTISSDFENIFSKDGSRLFLGLAPVRRPKDTTLVEFETARLDVWNYKDDYLSPQQLVQLNYELKKSYLAVINQIDQGDGRESGKLIPLGDENCETVIVAAEGNGKFALGQSSKGYRSREQWEQSGLQKLYLVDLRDGSRKLVKEEVRGGGSLSPEGRFISWYDWKKKNWFTYEAGTGRITIPTQQILVPLYDEEDDHPDDPPAHGMMGWSANDRSMYVYDRYDVWETDPAGQRNPVNLTKGIGRSDKITFRYIKLDKEERYLVPGQLVLLTLFNRKDMSSGWQLYRMGTPFTLNKATYSNSNVKSPASNGNVKSSAGQVISPTGPFSYNNFFKAKDSWTLGYLKGSFDKPYDLFITDSAQSFSRIQSPAGNQSSIGSQSSPGNQSYTGSQSSADLSDELRLSRINPQQSTYNWFTTELCHWKMLDGRMSEGLLYKPENFDSTKKYPVIFYFYERDAETRYNYLAPQPVRSSINIPWFVSNGYIVFDPNIYYKTGRPGEDAYNAVVSAARYMSRFKWVDSTKMGLQGHSWGGYQIAYLVTRTNLFAAAEAGAPVANMTSAYGGIRWGTGISRQFQYEKSQSRLGYSLWERPELYIKNSPLFRADKVKTPLLMMHNDADGAVPWYQGIEYFSALRRLGKKVWMIQYNGEDHGLTERRNRKDWSIRLGQFFGYYLKGEPPARWITEGVPATLKGIDWGLETPSPQVLQHTPQANSGAPATTGTAGPGY
ncbi:alpha/beta hydrolase family protein [Flavitalea flava]